MLTLIESKIQKLVDRTEPKIIDIITYVLMLISTSITLYLFVSSLEIMKSPIIRIHSNYIYTLNILLIILLFFFTMLGDKTSKPVNRPRIFLYSAINLTVITYALLSEVFNYSFTLLIDKLLEVADVPTFLIHTNVRIVTVFMPLLIVGVVFYKSIQIPFIKAYSDQLLEYKLDILTRVIYEINDNKVYLNICEDVATGEIIKVPEEITFRHELLIGNSGSGKTALNLRPDLGQLFYKKAYFREKLKELTYLALEKRLCYINAPITNAYFNKYFSMKFITPYDDKKDEFVKLFDEYIIGVRSSERILYDENFKGNGQDKITKEYPIIFHNNLDKLTIEINAYYNGMIKDEIKLDINSEINEKVECDDYLISITKKPYLREIRDDDGEVVIEHIVKEIENEETEERKVFSEYLELIITPRNTSKFGKYKFSATIEEKGNGKIIYRDLGIMVIAPDGGLAKDTYKIGKENGIKVHRIDPKMEEIRKGNVSKINPLLVGSPEKAADVVSSIFIAMDQGTGGKDSNPYYTNASIRAIRNVVILLRVAYPILNNNANPILTDVLDILNNFSLVQPYVFELEKDDNLRMRWKSVIDYFKTSFFPPVLDGTGKPMLNSNIGSKTKKTEDAISGIINQLDNFLGREEIRYILCDREESLNLSEVLENGDCIGVSTRQSDLGDILGKAFALMIMLSMQNAVLGRYSEDEEPEIPYHIKIDEFPFYLNDQTKVFFTFARKYKAAVTAAVQNLGQLEEVNKIFREIVFTNCSTKIVLPGANVEDREYFCKYFGIVEEFDITTSVTSNPVITENPRYSEAARGTLTEKSRVPEQDLADLEFKRCYYSTVNKKGKSIIGKGYIDFLKLTDKNTIKVKEYDFEKFNKNEDTVSILENDNNIDTSSSNKESDDCKIDTNELNHILIDALELDNVESLICQDSVFSSNENLCIKENDELSLNGIDILISNENEKDKVSQIKEDDKEERELLDFLEDSINNQEKPMEEKDIEETNNYSYSFNGDIDTMDINIKGLKD